MEDQSLEFTGVIGFPIHFLNAYLLALLALILLIVSFFAKVSGGVKWAGFILLVVVVQILLGMFARGLPALGALHGMNALLVLGLALTAATRATRDVSASEKSATSEREMV